MRQTILASAATALATAIVAIWGTAVIVGHTDKHPEVVVSTAIDVMKMMRDAKGLPEERFDAY